MYVCVYIYIYIYIYIHIYIYIYIYIYISNLRCSTGLGAPNIAAVSVLKIPNPEDIGRTEPKLDSAGVCEKQKVLQRKHGREDRLSEHQIRGWIAVSTAGLHGQGSHKRSCCFLHGHQYLGRCAPQLRAIFRPPREGSHPRQGMTDEIGTPDPNWSPR